jgi:hypothetical protein
MGLGLGLSMRWTLLFVFIIFSTSCLKPPSTEVDKGAATPCTELDAALNSIQYGSVQSIKKGEFVSIDSKTRLDIQPFEIVGQQSIEVTDLKQDTIDPRYNEVTLLVTLNEKQDNGIFKQSQTVEKAYIKRPDVFSLADFSTRASTSMCDKLKTGTLSYNKLQITEGYVEVPPAVQKSSSCGGLMDCTKIKARQLSFDRWIKDQDGKEVKYTNFVTASPDVPYFSTILSSCAQYTLVIDNRPILVTTCDEVKDFKFGQ